VEFKIGSELDLLNHAFCPYLRRSSMHHLYSALHRGV
jgi:hypothetical protein